MSNRAARNDPNDRAIFAATGDTGFSLYVYNAEEDSRWHTFTWKSAPMRRPSNRRIRIREVQLVVKAYDNSATLAVTVGGTTNSRTISSGRQTVAIMFDEIAEMLDVQVVSTAGSNSNEAPSIEMVRIGSRWTRRDRKRFVRFVRAGRPWSWPLRRYRGE